LIEQRMKIENIKKSQLYYKDPFNQEIHKLRETINEIEKITVGFKDKKKFYVQKLAEGIATIAAGVWKELKDGSIAPCIVRLSDFKTNEYRNLLGGWYYESDEHNPMLGFRGASRYVSNEFQDAFVLELEAIKLARQWGLKNIIPMIPFCRTPEEADKIEKIMKRNGLTKGENGLKVYCMAEIPSNIFLADVFCNYFDGFSIGSNDLTQLVYGSGRDNEKLIPIAQQFNYITNSGAIRRAVKQLIKIAHEHGKKVGICGQAPSDDPEFLRFLVREKIDSISLNFDTFARGKINTWRTETIEHRLEESQKDISYKFLREADELVSQIRGKLKTLDLDDDVNKKKYNDLSTQIVEMADNFVETIEEGSLEDFDSFYYKFVERLEKYRREIDNI
ncbi:MAG: putative PEP-binding protein, partial [Promethearchaeia archaeon]